MSVISAKLTPGGRLLCSGQRTVLDSGHGEERRGGDCLEDEGMLMD